MTPNVLLVSLDTLRADLAYSGRFPTMARLGREGTSFSTVVSAAPLTPVSHASVLTGQLPVHHGLRHLLRERIEPAVATLAEIFTGHGYSTAGVVSCPGLNRWYGFDRGFGVFDDEIPRLPDGTDALTLVDVKLRGTAMKRAPLVTERALSWLAAKPPQPWFLFVHYFDSHWPYEAPRLFDPAVANPYEGEVMYMDHYLGRLFDGLASVCVDLDETLVVCFSDHGEDLAGWYANDHAGPRGHAEEEGHGCLLFDATQLVPLWFRWPGRVPAGLRVPSQVRLIDIASTITDLLRFQAPRTDGEPLTAAFSGVVPVDRAAYCETFFREELTIKGVPAQLKPWKGIRIDRTLKVIWEVGGDAVWIYDLDRDPAERAPRVVAGSGPPVGLASAVAMCSTGRPGPP